MTPFCLVWLRRFWICLHCLLALFGLGQIVQAADPGLHPTVNFRRLDVFRNRLIVKFPKRDHNGLQDLEPPGRDFVIEQMSDQEGRSPLAAAPPQQLDGQQRYFHI